jgi:hypothetical protein
MWRCWISPGHKPVSSQRRGRGNRFDLVVGYPTPTFRNYGSAFPIKATSFASAYSFTEP